MTILIVSLFFTAFMEILFRFIFPIHAETRILHFDAISKILKRKSNLRGRIITPGAISRFRFNNEGWNSPRDYFPEKTARYRIACIGSSETESLQVDVNNSYPVILEESLRASGIENEVYSFAKGRTSLAQALHIVRHVTIRFHPDIIMVTPVNDLLIESFKPSNYMTLKISGDNTIREVLPAEYRPNLNYKNFKTLRSVLSHSKLVLVVFKMIESFIWQVIIRFLLKRSSAKNASVFTPNHELQLHSLKKRYPSFQKKYDLARTYLFGQFSELSRSNNVKIIFVLGPQLGIENARHEQSDLDIAWIKQCLDDHALPYYDLTEPFSADYSARGRSFTSLFDHRHFNTYGHKTAGKAIADFLTDNHYVS